MDKISRKENPAKSAALVGIMAATIECAKLVLAAVPNVEGVSFLIALYSFVFGWHGVVAALIFVCIEPLIWGFGSWVITYFLYWPFFGVVFLLLGRRGIKNRFLLCGIATLMTFWFGVLSSLVDIGLFSGYFDRFFYRFGIYYARGATFYITQIICNAVLFLCVFGYFERLLFRIKKKMKM